jgi:hypothetical protein
MSIQTATTGQLENAQRISIAMARYTAEHSAPTINLVEHMTLKSGEKSITLPDVGQMELSDLVDGQDIVDSEDIGMTTQSLTTSEVGMKVILTDKLVRQENEDVFKIVGRQMGDAMARKKDGDLTALFSALNAGVTLGQAAASKILNLKNLAACIAFAKAQKFPAPVVVVAHPNSVFGMVKEATAGPSATYPIPRGFSEDLLRDFYKFVINQVTIFENGNLDTDSDNDSVGAIFSKEALAYVESVGWNTERQRDASLRATEVVLTADYGVFEIADVKGAPMTYMSSAPATNN